MVLQGLAVFFVGRVIAVGLSFIIYTLWGAIFSTLKEQKGLKSLNLEEHSALELSNAYIDKNVNRFDDEELSFRALVVLCHHLGSSEGEILKDLQTLNTFAFSVESMRYLIRDTLKEIKAGDD